MQYSIPSFIVSGVSPFHQVGAGSDTATVICPALKGLAIGFDPLVPDNSQLPIISAAWAETDMMTPAMAATP
jgi:hypothetical protein